MQPVAARPFFVDVLQHMGVKAVEHRARFQMIALGHLDDFVDGFLLGEHAAEHQEGGAAGGDDPGGQPRQRICGHGPRHAPGGRRFGGFSLQGQPEKQGLRGEEGAKGREKGQPGVYPADGYGPFPGPHPAPHGPQSPDPGAVFQPGLPPGGRPQIRKPGRAQGAQALLLPDHLPLEGRGEGV
mgnify:CR=1 FL=1